MEPRIDLRSDTMTRPTDAMREAMANATVGNSALGEDPTVNELQDEAADLLGKESALFLASGTMANLASLIAWTRPLERPEVIAEATSHVLLYESSSIARVANAQAHPLEGQRGRIPLEALEENLRPREGPTVKPQTALVCLEDPHNHAGGTVLGQDYLKDAYELARGHDVPVHLDGARLFNAAVAQGVPVKALAQHADSVMVALTKGLGAPVGSLLAGPEPFVEDAARAKALLGGGMRQAGHLAAAAKLALNEGPKRLEQDHENARRLARGADDVQGLSVDLDRVDTSIVFVDVSGLGVDASTFASELMEEDVGVDGMMRETHVRAVTHRDVSESDVDEALEALSTVAARL